MKIVPALSVVLLVASCAPVYYAPNAHNVPLFSEKNEATVSASFAILDNPEPMTGTDLQLAIAVSDHVGIMANGMFTKAEHAILFCTVIRSDVNTLKAVVSDIDPNAFVVIGQGHQASGGVLP